MRFKLTETRPSPLLVLSVLLAGSFLMNALDPVYAQGPGVQVIRLNDVHGPAATASVSQPAQSNETTVNGFNTQSPSSAAVINDKAALSAGASVVDVELANVRDILLDVRRAKEAAAHLYGEVTRHPITGYSYVDAMGPVMMEIPMPTFDMSQVLPARRQWVELYMGEISSVMAYIKADLDGIKSGGANLSLPEKDKPTFDKDLQECSASIDRAIDYGGQLKKLTGAPPYDNLSIAKLISPLHKELREVEKTTKRLIGQVKKSH